MEFSVSTGVDDYFMGDADVGHSAALGDVDALSDISGFDDAEYELHFDVDDFISDPTEQPSALPTIPPFVSHRRVSLILEFIS